MKTAKHRFTPSLQTCNLRFEWINPQDGEENPLKWRTHSQDQSETLDSFIFGKNGVGWAGAALLNDRQIEDGWSPEEAHPVFIDGHDRRKLAIKHKGKLPALIGRWTPKQERLILSLLDPLGEQAGIDDLAREALLRQVESECEDFASIIKIAASAGDTPEEIDLRQFAEFKEFDESIVKTVQYNECPNCGHKWPR